MSLGSWILKEEDKSVGGKSKRKEEEERDEAERRRKRGENVKINFYALATTGDTRKASRQKQSIFYIRRGTDEI